MVRNFFFFLVIAEVRGKKRHGKIFKNSSETVSVFSLGSLLDFLKSDMGSRLLLPKLIDFSAQVNFTRIATCCSFALLTLPHDCVRGIESLFPSLNQKEEQEAQFSQIRGRARLSFLVLVTQAH